MTDSDTETFTDFQEAQTQQNAAFEAPGSAEKPGASASTPVDRAQLAGMQAIVETMMLSQAKLQARLFDKLAVDLGDTMRSALKEGFDEIQEKQMQARVLDQVLETSTQEQAKQIENIQKSLTCACLPAWDA